MNRDKLDKIGRRMPYKVPEGYFENMLSDINAVRPYYIHGFAVLRRIALAAASVAVVLFASYMAFDRSRITDADVDDAFLAMSDTDRVAILEIFQDDLYFYE